MKSLVRTLVALSFILLTSFTPRTGYAEGNAAGGLDPLKCSFPPGEFRGTSAETKAWMANYKKTNDAVEKCRGLAFVSQKGADRTDWEVICSGQTQGSFVMPIPETIRGGGKRYTVYNKTNGQVFGLDELPAARGAVGEAAYYSKVCNEKATVNFKVSGCKNISFNPADYGSGKPARAFLIKEAADDCDKIANNHDAKDAVARLVNRKDFAELKKCGSN